MNSFATTKIPDWVRTLQKKYKLKDDEVFALCSAKEEVEYLQSLDVNGHDKKFDDKIDALKKKAKALESFGSSNYRWPKSIPTIRYELRARLSNDEVFNNAVDILFAMKNVPRKTDYGMIKARKSDEEDLKMLHYRGEDENR